MVLVIPRRATGYYSPDRSVGVLVTKLARRCFDLHCSNYPNRAQLVE